MRVHGRPVTLARAVAWAFPVYIFLIGAGAWLIQVVAFSFNP